MKRIFCVGAAAMVMATGCVVEPPDDVIPEWRNLPGPDEGDETPEAGPESNGLGRVEVPIDESPFEGTPRDYFEQYVASGLLESCGGCHRQGNANFLFDDAYDSIVQHRFITEDAEASRILSYPDSQEHADHGGRNWQGLEGLREHVKQWLELEAAAFVPPEHIELDPVLPGGHVTVPLDVLGPDFAGASMTFYGIELGDPVTLLRLTNVELWPRYGTSIRVDNISVVLRSEQGDEFVDNSMHGAPFTVMAPGSVAVADEVVLTDWTANGQLVVRFDDITVEDIADE